MKVEDKDDLRFKVLIRVRPPSEKEKKNPYFDNIVTISNNNTRIDLREKYLLEEEEDDEDMFINNHTFTFDQIFDSNSKQPEIFDKGAKKAVHAVLKGYNSTILAYGQTGTGKTFTMEGGNKQKNFSNQQKKGIIPRVIEEIFSCLSQNNSSFDKVIVRVSYLQVYNETISDLLKSDRNNLNIREDCKKGIYVEKLSEWIVRNPKDVKKLIKKGSSNRVTAFTNINDISSRSHAVFIITVEQLIKSKVGKKQIQSCRIAKLNLIDLAGSERLKITNARGIRLEECKKINQSLSSLGKVISCLADKGLKQKKHIPYRDSKLTRLLEDSLGGNCITTFIAMISPCVISFNESLSTLKFAKRAKKIKNKPKINENINKTGLLVKYEQELLRLKEELQIKNKNFIDKNKIHELKEKQRQAEEDKLEALEKLEEKTKAFYQEREEKRLLKQKINYLEKQVLSNSINFKDFFKNNKSEAKNHVKNVENLNQNNPMNEYKDLILKQKQMMMNLRKNLKEKENYINQLQEELDSYDNVHVETEELLNIKNQKIRQLESIIEKNHIQVPIFKPLPSRIELNEIDDDDFENFERMIYNNSLSHSFNKTKEYEKTDKKDKKELQENYNVKMNKLKTEFQDKLNILNEKHLEKNQELVEELGKSKQDNQKLLGIIQDKFKKNFFNLNNQNNLEILQSKINNIVEELSIANKPENLHIVAKNLLSLHKYIENLCKKNMEKNVKLKKKLNLLNKSEKEKNNNESLITDSRKVVLRKKQEIEGKKKLKKKKFKGSKSTKILMKDEKIDFKLILADNEQMKTIKESKKKNIKKRYRPSDLLNYYNISYNHKKM